MLTAERACLGRRGFRSCIYLTVNGYVCVLTTALLHLLYLMPCHGRNPDHAWPRTCPHLGNSIQQSQPEDGQGCPNARMGCSSVQEERALKSPGACRMSGTCANLCRDLQHSDLVEVERWGRGEEDDLIARERERMTMAWILPRTDLESFPHAYLVSCPTASQEVRKLFEIGLEGELQ